MTDSPVIEDQTARGTDMAIPIEDLVPLVGRWVLPLLLAFPVVHILIWGPVAFFGSLFSGASLWLIPELILLVVAHEATHVLGWMIAGRIPPRRFSFGVDWKTLSPYAHTEASMSARAYRIGALLPSVTTALLPGIVGIVQASAPLTMVAAVMLVGASSEGYM